MTPVVQPSLVVYIAGTLVVIVGIGVLGMIGAVIRAYAHSLRRSGSGGYRLMSWHVLLVSASQTCFVVPIILGVLDVLGADLPVSREVRFGLYLAGLFLTAIALVIVTRHIRQRDAQAGPPGEPDAARGEEA